MGAFFWSWQLWMQMTFALACAMVVVLCIALLRNAADWWNLRKHVRILKEKQAEQAKLLEMHPSIRKRQQKNQIPFGVRAIQSGIEVEGVWISRPNSTIQSPDTTSPSSPRALQPQKLRSDLSVQPLQKDEDLRNPVAAAARQLEIQTAAGRVIPPRATFDPFRDNTTTSDRSLVNARTGTGGGASTKSRVTSGMSYGAPSEEALHETGDAYRTARQSFQSDRTQAQPQTYAPTRKPDHWQNTSLPSPRTSRRGSYGYNYPQGYSQPSDQLDSPQESPDEMDISQVQEDSFSRPERAFNIQHTRMASSEIDPTSLSRQNRNSSYHMVFSQPGPLSSEAAPRRTSQQQAPVMEATDRAEAEAQASNMRIVNEGFSVARRGQRRDHESLIQAVRDVQQQAEQPGSGGDGSKTARKKLQKKDRHSRLSQFRENV